MVRVCVVLLRGLDIPCRRHGRAWREWVVFIAYVDEQVDKVEALTCEGFRDKKIRLADESRDVGIGLRSRDGR